MTDEYITEQLHKWIKDDQKMLERDWYITRHINELIEQPFERNKTNNDYLPVTIKAYQLLIQKCNLDWGAYIPRVIIGLPDAKRFSRTIPSESEIITAKQATPPAFYVIERKKLEAPWKGEKYSFVFDLNWFPDLHRNVLIEYKIQRPECARRLDEGYERSICISYFPNELLVMRDGKYYFPGEIY